MLLLASLGTHAQSPPTFAIRGYQIEGNSLLPQASVSLAVMPFTGAKSSFETIQLALEALEKAYLKAGFGSVKIEVPEQDLQEGVVKLLLFQLLSGGLRVATGLIGKSAPRMVKFQTNTATIGIRGTVFDLSCGKAGAGDDPQAADVTDIECNEALYASTRTGEITLTAADGKELSVPAGQSGVVPGQGPARPLATTPAFFNGLATPAPESVDVNIEQLFGGATVAPDTSGVYLMVREGKVVMGQSGQVISLDAGESAFAGQSLVPVRLASTPILLDRDPALSNRAFNFNICRP